METYNVEYSSGQSRYGTEAVDYMLVIADGVELYAETAPEETVGDGYRALKASIIEQAAAVGIPAEALVLWF